MQHEATLDDPRVIEIVRRCQQLPGQELFHYEDDDGTPRPLSSTDVNDYLREAADGDFTAKNFRTWHGTVEVLELTRLSCSNATDSASKSLRYSAKEIIESVAKRLGNTPSLQKSLCASRGPVAGAPHWQRMLAQ